MGAWWTRTSGPNPGRAGEGASQKRPQSPSGVEFIEVDEAKVYVGIVAGGLWSKPFGLQTLYII